MSSSSTVEPVNPFFAAGTRRARQLAEAVPAMRPAGAPATARARISAAKPKKRARALPAAPTPERLAKGDAVRTNAGFHRAIPVVERLRDQHKLDHDARVNAAMYDAAEKLRRHHEACAIGPLKAQDLNRIGGGTGGDETIEEAWVRHRDVYQTALKLMGYSATHPHRGAARLVVAVCCEGQTVSDAAVLHIGRGQKAAQMGAAMDRLREGLFALAAHWRMC